MLPPGPFGTDTAEPVRRLCATLARLPRGPLPTCRVEGRVLGVEHDPGCSDACCFVVGDRSGTLVVQWADGSGTLPRPGDIVAAVVDGVVARGQVRGTAWTLLTPYQAERPFPAVGGEYHRLQCRRAAAIALTRVDRLRQRARALAAARAFFDDAGYIEVQAPLRVRAPGLEPHLVAEPSGDRFLITSPEYHMKRLLAGGLERIYFLGPCWRGDELGRHHLGEFTMVEWYCAHGDLEALMAETEALVRRVVCAVRGAIDGFDYQGRPVDLSRPFSRLTIAEAAARHAGVDLRGVVDPVELRRRLVVAGLIDATVATVATESGDEGFDALLSRLLVERIEPALATAPGPVFLTEFPAPVAALSRLKPADPSVADRFELYAGGLELANAFGELTDAGEQQRRLEADQRARRDAGAPVHEIDRAFVDALREGIPPTAGIALGFDRLLMLACAAGRIDEVVAFGPDEV